MGLFLSILLELIGIANCEDWLLVLMLETSWGHLGIPLHPGVFWALMAAQDQIHLP